MSKEKGKEGRKRREEPEDQEPELIGLTEE